MSENNPLLSNERRWLLSEAATDFFFLQNRRYPRASSLETVGNRYGLTAMERLILHRGVFSREDALRRRSRKARGNDWRKGLFVVDGHNVQITVESVLLGRPLLLGNDGALRDVAGQSSKYRLSDVSTLALDTIFRFLEEHRPREAVFLFDSPMSHSGELAGEYAQRLKLLGISGFARAVPVPEREIPYSDCTVASSDGQVLDRSLWWLDLAHLASGSMGNLHLTMDFSWLNEASGAVPSGTCGEHMAPGD